MADGLLVRLRGLMGGGRRGALLGVGGLSCLGLLLSLATQMTISAFLGTSVELDAYWIAFAWLNFIIFFVTPLREALTPLVFAKLESDHDHAMDSLANGLGLIVLGLAGATLVTLVIVLVLSLNPHVPPAYARAAMPMLWLVPAIFLYALAETLNSLLSCYGRPVLQQGVRLGWNVTMLAVIVLLVQWLGVMSIALGFVLGQAVMVGLQWRILTRLGMRLQVRWPRQLDRGFLVTGGSLIVSYFLTQSYGVVEKLAFAHMQDGLVSAYQYALTLLNGLVTLFGAVSATALFPSLLQSGAKGALDEMGALLGRAIHWLLFLTVWLCGGTWVLAPQIVQIMFMRGHFSAESADLTTFCLRMVIFVTVPMSVMALLWRALLALPRGRAVGMAVSTAMVAVTGMLMLGLATWVNDRTLLLSQALVANLAGIAVCLFWVRRGGVRMPGLRRVLLVLLWVVPAAWMGLQAGQMLTHPLLVILVGGAVFTVCYGGLCYVSHVFPRWREA